MSQISHFKITKNAASEQDATSLTSPLKRWQLYDKETSVSFFYSEIEACWLIRVNSGSCRIDDQLVYSHSESAMVVEKSVDVVINGISFKFTNLGRAKGISKMLVHTLLGRREYKVNMETVLRLIYNNCNCYLDFYFILDAIRKNRMFNYRCDEIMLDVELLHSDLTKKRSPIIESLKYEAENRVLRDKLKAFNVSKIWACSEFNMMAGVITEPVEKWPSSKALQSAIKMLGQLAPSTKGLLPSPQSSCRYINSYQIKGSSDINENISSRQSFVVDEDFGSSTPSESDEMYSASSIMSQDGFDSHPESDESEVMVEKRKKASTGKKRPKYHFDLKTQPVVESMKASSDTEQSIDTYASDVPQETVTELRSMLQRSASCVEDGFQCERYDETVYASGCERRGRHGTVYRYEWHRVKKP